MTIEQFNKLKNKEVSIHINDLEDKSNRTLIYGYELNRDTFHMYIEDEKFNKIIYSYPDKLIYHFHGSSIPLKEVNPSKRAYPERCDFEFCKLLMNAGVDIPFTVYDQNGISNSQYYGLTVAETN